jgi:hypothetical protein
MVRFAKKSALLSAAGALMFAAPALAAEAHYRCGRRGQADRQVLSARLA